MPAADFCGMVRMDCSFLSHDFVTCRRSPEVSSIAFHAQPPDLHSALLMDMGFVAICQLARSPPASNPVLVHQLACLLRASFRPRLATRPLRFAITSRPSRCEEDLHLQAIDHARHTNERGSGQSRNPFFRLLRRVKRIAIGLTPPRLAPRARCAQLCCASKPGGVIHPLRSSRSSQPACTPTQTHRQDNSLTNCKRTLSLLLLTNYPVTFSSWAYFRNSVSRSWSRPIYDFMLRKRPNNS